MKSILSVFIFICLNACNGWYIAGYELEPEYIDPNVFHTVFDQDSTKQIIENIKNNIPNKIGSQKGRKSSENA